MVNDRPPTDPRSTVEEPRDRTLLIFLAAILILVAWAARDSIVDPFLDPSDIDELDSLSPPPGSVVAVRPPEGVLSGLVTGNDYPVAALRRDEQGTTQVLLSVDRLGRAARCAILSSSGSRSLDEATCRILKQRARFKPAQDASGAPVEGTFQQRITWRLEG